MVGVERMKRAWPVLLMVLFAGCSESPRGVARGRYPALDESPPPPIPARNRTLGTDGAASGSEDAPAVVVDESARWKLVEEQAWALREYAAKAEPDDPFALTEAEIHALEASEGQPLTH